MKLNPTLIEYNDDTICFGMFKYNGRLRLSTKTLVPMKLNNLKKLFYRLAEGLKVVLIRLATADSSYAENADEIILSSKPILY